MRNEDHIEVAQNVIGLTLIAISFCGFVLMAYSFGGNN